MKTIEGYIPSGHPNRPGKKLEALKAIVIHYTQNENPAMSDTMNVKYIGRRWENGKYWSKSKGVAVEGTIEAGSMGKGENGLGIQFHYGSAHVFCDMDSVTLAIPIDEVAWGCGDRNFHGGFQKIAESVFKRRQNFQTVSVEICNNDVIKNSDEDWNASVANAKQWTINFLKSKNLIVDVTGSLEPQKLKAAPEEGIVLILRHYDITGKNCPAPFVADAEAWESFVNEVADAVA